MKTHEDFVNKYDKSTGERVAKTLPLRKSLMEFFAKSMEEFTEIYRDWIPSIEEVIDPIKNAEPKEKKPGQSKGAAKKNAKRKAAEESEEEESLVSKKNKKSKK